MLSVLQSEKRGRETWIEPIYRGQQGVMHVFVVEDEKKIASFIEKELVAQSFTTDVCENGDDALAVIRTRSFDVIILDIMLPGRDGLSILRLMREEGNQTPVIVITARGEVSERIEGLNLGADDYLAKPFYVDELMARVRSVMRRSSGQGLSLLSVEDLTLNLMTREVRRAETDLFLSPREFALLEYLMRTPGRVLTRIQICEHVWDYHFDPQTNLVDVYIQRLRRKVDDGHEQKLIETVRGVGYRMANRS